MSGHGIIIAQRHQLIYTEGWAPFMEASLASRVRCRDFAILILFPLVSLLALRLRCSDELRLLPRARKAMMN